MAPLDALISTNVTEEKQIASGSTAETGCTNIGTEKGHYECSEIQYKLMKELERDGRINIPQAALQDPVAAAHIQSSLSKTPHDSDDKT